MTAIRTFPALALAATLALSGCAFGGGTPLAAAAAAGDLSAMTALLDKGADPNASGRLGMTPLARYQQALARAGYGCITTEVLPAPAFYYAEEYHQQYLAKNPGSYCGLGGTGVSCAA